MQILDRAAEFSKIDPKGMRAEIEGLPGQLQAAYQFGLAQSLPEWKDVRQVLIAGMGGSAIGADLLCAWVQSVCPVPVFIQRDYTLPSWARQYGTLVICSSHSGNTEETLSVFEQARQADCRMLAISTGGKLSQLALEAGTPLWRFIHSGQPRAAVGWSFGLLLAVFYRLGLIPDPQLDLINTVSAMRYQQETIGCESPVVMNPAKRLAGQMVGRWPVVMGAGILAPVARRWKGQLSELAKCWAQFEVLPEADHNSVAGVRYPEGPLSQTMVVFLESPADHPRNNLRAQVTRKILMLEGLGTDTYTAAGNSALANQWTALHFGDYVAYYLAMIYGVDPTPVDSIESLKMELQRAG